MAHSRSIVDKENGVVCRTETLGGQCTPTPEAIIGRMYRTILGRNPDAGGLAAYVEELRKGASLDHILSVLLNLDEFMRRVDKRFAQVFTEKTKPQFLVGYDPPPNEAGKTYCARRANGFFERLVSGEKILDIGYKGYDNRRRRPSSRTRSELIWTFRAMMISASHSTTKDQLDLQRPLS